MLKKLVLILLSLFILGATVSVGYQIGGLYNEAFVKGAFVKWQQLGTPEGKASEILAANTGEVYVLTESGSIYRCWVSDYGNGCEEAKNAQEKVQDVFSRHPCGRTPYTRARPLNKEVVASVETSECYGEPIEYAIYAISEDGEVWAWYRWTGGYFGIGSALVSVAVGILAGLIVGIILVVILWKIVARRSAPVE